MASTLPEKIGDKIQRASNHAKFMMTRSRSRFLKLPRRRWRCRRCCVRASPRKKPIRAIVPFTPGSTIDLLGRIALDPGSHRVGQIIVVENKAGAGGTIGSFEALIKREIASNLAVSLD